MFAMNCRIVLTACALAALGACSNTSGVQAATSAEGAPAASAKAIDPPRSVDAKTYCAKLQPAVQSKM